MTESEIMEAHSATWKDRAAWAFKGNEEAVAMKIAENSNPNLTINKQNRNVFYNRMGGMSDDGRRVIGKQSSELPGCP